MKNEVINRERSKNSGACLTRNSTCTSLKQNKLLHSYPNTPTKIYNHRYTHKSYWPDTLGTGQSVPIQCYCQDHFQTSASDRPDPLLLFPAKPSASVARRSWRYTLWHLMLILPPLALTSGRFTGQCMTSNTPHFTRPVVILVGSLEACCRCRQRVMVSLDICTCWTDVCRCLLVKP